MCIIYLYIQKLYSEHLELKFSVYLNICNILKQTNNLRSLSLTGIGTLANQVVQVVKTVHTFGRRFHISGMTYIVNGISLTYVKNIKVRNSGIIYVL